ncbi:hypothetical protein F4774DRAFT_399915 [Daldinia eschscholtzii]|nr:hypothetical protein F4774DRAFT_399915 [Daldinia eschscholtzii]
MHGFNRRREMANRLLIARGNLDIRHTILFIWFGTSLFAVASCFRLSFSPYSLRGSSRVGYPFVLCYSLLEMGLVLYLGIQGHGNGKSKIIAYLSERRSSSGCV